jgi:hypothetical protein
MKESVVKLKNPFCQEIKIQKCCYCIILLDSITCVSQAEQMPNFRTLSKYGRSSDIGMYKVSVKHVKSHTFVEEDKLNNNYSCHIQLIIVDLLYTEDQ